MHIQTHILAGWCIADFFELTPRERFFAMVAAAVADLDGLGLLVSIDYYVAWHHVLGHNLLAAVIVASILAAFSTHRTKAFWLFLALFHLHLVLDYYGSGPGWGIHYLWPFSSHVIEYPYAWNLASWQNTCAFAVLFIWTILIAFRRRRTPFEVMMPTFDGVSIQIVDKIAIRKPPNDTA